MRSIWRTLGRDLARDITVVCLADGFVGLSFGAIAVTNGLPLWLPVLMSVVVFAGAAQFLFVALVASGGNPIAAAVAGLVVNARHLPFGLAVGRLLGDGWRRAVGSHLMVDESVAFALAQDDGRRRRAAYWASGVMLFTCWNAGVVLGAFAGTVVKDTDVLGLDAAFPAVLLALVMPALRDRLTLKAALVGAAVAVAASPFLPPGVPVLMAIVGLLVVVRRPAQAEERETAA